MKNKIKIFFLMGLFALVGFEKVQAQDSVQSITNIYATLSTNAVNASTDLTVTSTAFWIKAGQGFAVVPTFSGSALGTGNVTFRFALSLDGTNWTTTTPLTYAVAANGTNTVRGYANFGPSTLNNIRYARLASINNEATNRVTLSSLQISRNRE